MVIKADGSCYLKHLEDKGLDKYAIGLYERWGKSLPLHHPTKVHQQLWKELNYSNDLLHSPKEPVTILL